MNCPFCAEEIREEAVLCRFCGAKKEAESWVAPAKPVVAATTSPPPGETTIRLAALFLIVSGIIDAAMVTSKVPLFGELRSGAMAITYHAIYALLFIGMGVGFLRRARFSLHLVTAATLVYAIDKISWLISPVESEAIRELRRTDLMDVESLDSLVSLLTATTLVCWIGFALYIWWRRDYFRGR